MLRSRAMYRWALPLLIVACSETAEVEPAERFEVAQFPSVERTQLDLLLVVDNSGGMPELQITLGTAMPSLFSQIARAGVLPDLHIGFTTSDLGTTGSLDPEHPAPGVGTVGNGGCGGAGDAGSLRSVLVNEDDGAGGRIQNYEGTLAEAVSRALLRLGGTGCGFEQHLHALRRATRGNASFWRPDASRAVIVLADEDDCSVRDARLFAPETPLGPLTSFRCTRAGLVCDQPLDDPGLKTNCRPAGDGFLDRPIHAKLELEAAIDPARLTFSVIAGERGPIGVELRMQGGTQQLALAHACGWQSPTGASAADPALRLATLADSFRSRGVYRSSCTLQLGPAVTDIATAIQRSLGVACLDRDAALDLASCVAFEVDASARAPLPRCPAAADCFDIAADAQCGGGPRVVIDRKSSPSPTAHIEVACAR